MKLNVSVFLSNVKDKKGKQQVQVYNNGVAVTQDAVNKQLQLLAKSIDDVNAAVLHLAKTSAVKAKHNSCCERKHNEPVCGEREIYYDEKAKIVIVEVEIGYYDDVKIVNQNLVILDGDKFKVVEALDEFGNATKKLKEAVKFRGFWKD